jgi:hypothetical protein
MRSLALGPSTKMRIALGIYITLLLIGSAGAQRIVIGKSLPTSVVTTGGCGVGTDGSLCGPVAPFDAAAGGTNEASCPGSLGSGTYSLTADVGSTASATCITVTATPFKLDLAGHTLTGRIVANSVALSGIEVYSSATGGTVTCSDASASNPGCIYLGGDGTTSIAAVNKIHHFTCLNTSNSSSNSERCVMADFGGVASTTVVGANFKIYNMAGTSALGASSSRIVNFQVQGTAHTTKGYAEFYNNTATCQSLAAACQGIVAYGLYDAKIHNNNLTNQLADASLTETPRAMLCDQTDGCEMYSNIVSCQDGRCARFRGSSNTNDVNSLHDNIFNNIVAGTNPNYVGSIHIGDPDCPTPCQEAENLTQSNNTLNVTTGAAQEFMHGMVVRNATAVALSGNIVATAQNIDNFFSWRTQSSGIDSGTVYSTTTTGGGALTSSCDSGATVTFCNSGAASGGSCTVDNSLCSGSPAIPAIPTTAKTFSNLETSSIGTGNNLWTKCNSNGSNDNGTPCAAGTSNGLGAATITIGASKPIPLPASGYCSTLAGNPLRFDNASSGGTVNTSGTAVTWVSGSTFNANWAGLPISINSTSYTISSVTDSTHLVLTATAGTQSGVTYASTTGFNTLNYQHLGPGPWMANDGTSSVTLGGVSHAVLDFCFYGAPNAGGLTGYEWDPDFFVAATWTYKISLACYHTSDKWYVYDQSIQNWRQTNTSCALNTTGASQWHHLQLYATIDQTNHQYTYQSLVLDEVPIWTPSNPPTCPSLSNAACPTFGAWNHNSGTQGNVEMQIDSTSTTGTSTGYYLGYNYSIW